MVLAKLQGSEKQIAWAEKIRKQFIDRYFGCSQEAEKYEKLTEEAIAVVDSAKFWIDNRDYLESRCEAGLAQKLRQAAKKISVPPQSKIEQFPIPSMEMLFESAPAGTPKQSAWAEQIRIDFVQSIVACHCELRGEIAMGKRLDWLESEEELRRVLEAASSASAKFWIDNRETGNIAISKKLLTVSLANNQ